MGGVYNTKRCQSGYTLYSLDYKKQSHHVGERGSSHCKILELKTAQSAHLYHLLSEEWGMPILEKGL